MKKAARLTLVLAALVLAALPLALAADAPKAVGTWDVVAQTPNGEMPSVLTIKATASGVKAEFELDGAARIVSDEKLVGEVLTFKVQHEGGVYDVEAKITGDTLEGTWQGNGASGTMKAKRRP